MSFFVTPEARLVSYRLDTPPRSVLNTTLFPSGVQTGVTAWASQLVSVLSIQGLASEFLDDSTHYHADYVTPSWSDDLRRISQIGKHIFYE